MKMAIDAEGNISYRLSMDQISTLAARLHVDLRRQASAVCPGGACAGGLAAAGQLSPRRASLDPFITFAFIPVAHRFLLRCRDYAMRIQRV